MPPLPVWLQGPEAIGASIGGMVLTPEARGAFRFLVTEANGLPALAAYQKNEHGVFVATAIHVLGIEAGGARPASVKAITAFLDPRLFAPFELPGEAP